MSSEDELKGFRIGDKRRPEVRGQQSAVGVKGTVPEASPSAGFPAIESRLEQKTVEEVAAELRGSYEKLEALAESKNKKEKAAAEKAMAAYERTADLFEYLYLTKEALGRSK
jgi:hypothetical protein